MNMSRRNLPSVALMRICWDTGSRIGWHIGNIGYLVTGQDAERTRDEHPPAAGTRIDKCSDWLSSEHKQAYGCPACGGHAGSNRITNTGPSRRSGLRVRSPVPGQLTRSGAWGGPGGDEGGQVGRGDLVLLTGVHVPHGDQTCLALLLAVDEPESGPAVRGPLELAAEFATGAQVDLGRQARAAQAGREVHRLGLVGQDRDRGVQTRRGDRLGAEQADDPLHPQ